ncbi:MAG: hypothetical protein KC550_04025 [Nanoarchaeota archaeon]|nr:hypothetical protein [Nanoarchaeota archaeon]
MEDKEMIKLAIIVGSGLFLMLIGNIIQRRNKAKKAAEEKAMMSGESTNNSSPATSSLSPQEEKAKTYIETYKSDYPRESLRSGLINNGNSETDVDTWLDKYM